MIMDFSDINEIISHSLGEEKKYGKPKGRFRSEIRNIDREWDRKTRRDQEDFDRKVQHEIHAADLADRKSSREMRESYALRVFTYVCAYSCFCAVVILCQGFDGVPKHTEAGNYLFFHISDQALCILIGSTATAIIGLIAIVLKGLFPKKDN